jgi:hypothetical protein
MANSLSELFNYNTDKDYPWSKVVDSQFCHFLGRKCNKVRKSTSHIALGTCTVCYGKENREIMICPHRLLEGDKIFIDSLHLLTMHEPGNEIHIVPEISIPGGNVDYMIASVRQGKVVDFVGIELQTMDTTGTVWNARQNFLKGQNIKVDESTILNKSFGINWKMTAKTILVQLHHKIETFQHLNKHLVLVSQDVLTNYMKGNFNFQEMQEPSLGNSMHFHSYKMLKEDDNELKIQLTERFSTDAEGLALSMGLKAEANIELEEVLKHIRRKISDQTLLKIK